MGIIRNLKEKEKNKVKSKVKKAIMTALIPILKILLKFSIILVVLFGVTGLFSWIIEKMTAKNTPEEIYKELGITEVRELVEIKGNDVTGYHLEFVEGIDEKLDALIEKLDGQSGLYSLQKVNKDLLKKMIKAEVVTQFPNLGGITNPLSSNQFQGSITVRRVTPNKEIGELKSTGAGESTTEDDLKYENNEEDQKITYEKGQKLQINDNAVLYLKGEYEFNGTKKSDDGVTLKSTVMISQIEGINSSVNVSKNDTVYYTGNTFYYENNTYIEIAEDKDVTVVIGYIKNIYADAYKQVINNNQENNVQEIQPTKMMGDGSKEFVIAIAAGHNSTDDKGYSDENWIEENLTIEVAQEVERLFKQYSDVKVIQTGSTYSKDVKREERVQLTKDANPDICIQIYFNSGNGGTGVEACYEYGDGKSQRLAEILTEKVSDKMGLLNRGSITVGGVSDYYDIIESSASTGYPSIIAKGCFLDNSKDTEVLTKGGTMLYAQGIVQACEQYIATDNGDDIITDVEELETYSRINSRIYDLEYVSQDTFNSYLENGNKKVLDVYTLDDDYNLITASWTTQGSITEYKKNSAMNFRTILENATIPYEYLLFFLIDSDKKEFVEELADIVIDETEIVIAVQDNITTTNVETTVQQTTRITSDEGEKAGKFAKAWHNVDDNEDSFTEICSSSVTVTYADTWCMKYSKGNSYSATSLNVDVGEKVDTEKNVKGKVTETVSTTKDSWNDDGSGGKLISSGTGKYTVLKPGTTTKAEDASGENVEEFTYTYSIYEGKKIETHTISNQYEDGEAVVSGDVSKFVKLYKKHEMTKAVAEEWLLDIIADNDRTAKYLDLTKYMMYLATDIDYGVTDFNFSVYDLSSFGNVSYGGEILSYYLKCWENGAVAAYVNDQSSYTSYVSKYITQDKTKYICYTDLNGTRNFGYGVCHWTGRAWNNVEKYESLGVNIKEDRYNQLGVSTLDVSIVDNVMQIYIDNAKSSVEKQVSQAGIQIEENQINALTAIAYQYGNIGNFTTAYSQYGNTEEFRNNFVVNGYKAFVTGYKGSSHEIKRANANWKAFNENIYTDASGNVIDPSQFTGGNIVQNAVQLHEYLRSNGYKYQQKGISLPNLNGRTIDCSSYVTWVLINSGVSGFTEGMYQWTSAKFTTNPLGWQEVSIGEAKPGDIVTYNGHVEIIAGEGSGGRFLVYNCGGDESIMANGKAYGIPEASMSGYSKAAIKKVLRVPSN